MITKLREGRTFVEQLGKIQNSEVRFEYRRKAELSKNRAVFSKKLETFSKLRRNQR